MAFFVAPAIGLYWVSDTDPTVAPGVDAPLFQILFRTDTLSLYVKTGAASTAWTPFGLGMGVAPNVGCSYFDDFLGREITTFSALGGAANAIGMVLGSNRPGTVTTTVAAAGADSSRLSLGANNDTSLFFGGGLVRLEFAHNIQTLSDGANKIVVRDGYGDVAAADYQDGVWLEYDDTLSANYQLCTALNSVRTRVDTGILVTAGTTRKCIIVINAAGTLVTASIDGVASSNSVNTNIPNAVNRTTQVSFQTLKTLGAASRAIFRDYYHHLQIFTTPR